MSISNSRALEIIKNQTTALSEIASISELHRGELKRLSTALTVDMVGDLNPANAIQMPVFIGLVNDGHRVYNSDKPGARNISNRIGQLSRGISPIWSKVDEKGLSILLEICDVIDAIADEFVGED